MKAIKIDVVSRELSYVEINDYSEIYHEIGNGCRLFCVPFEFENGDTIFSDDEALLNEVHGGFMLKGWRYPLCGNAIIQGCDDDGESIEVKSTIEDILPRIIWVDKKASQEWQYHAMLKGIEVVYF
jgi:hypothetical protein